MKYLQLKLSIESDRCVRALCIRRSSERSYVCVLLLLALLNCYYYYFHFLSD